MHATVSFIQYLIPILIKLITIIWITALIQKNNYKNNSNNNNNNNNQSAFGLKVNSY